MALTRKTISGVRRLRALGTRLNEVLIGREQAVELILLAALCQEHILLLGAPGVAKTMLATVFADSINARRFEHQLTRFTEPSELFGPLDVERFRNGEYRIRTENMLADAEIAFLDEVFEGNSAILNALLSLINERAFHNAGRREPAPLISLIGASNRLPTDDGLRAFSDRFALRLKLEPVSEPELRALLETGWANERARILGAEAEATIIAVDELRELGRAVADVNLTGITEEYLTLVQMLRRNGVELSDRRIVRGLRLLAGAALLDQRDRAEIRDFWPLQHIWAREEDRRPLSEAITEIAGDLGRATSDQRGPEALKADLARLLSEEVDITTEAAAFRHLRTLGSLKRECFDLDDADRDELLDQIVAAIARVDEISANMEVRHV